MKPIDNYIESKGIFTEINRTYLLFTMYNVYYVKCHHYSHHVS